MTTTRRVALALVAAAVAAGAYLAGHLRIDRDVVAFLPRGGSASQQFLASQLRDSAAARVVLMRITGADATTLGSASEALRTALVASGAFDYVTNGSLAAGLRDLPPLHAARYVLSADAASHMTQAGLVAALAQRYDALGGSAALLEKRFVADDPTGETLQLLASLQGSRSPRREAGVWFDTAGSGAMLLAQTRAPASDTAAQGAAQVAIDTAFAGVNGHRSLRIEFSSSGFLAARSEAVIARDAQWVSWVATLGIAVLLFLFYRAPRIVLLCALPAVAGIVAGVCAVIAGFGSVHAITLAFGTTLLGEAVDYPSYLLTRMDGHESAAKARLCLRAPFMLAVLTTALGALAFLGTGVEGLIQLGVLTGVGVLVAGVCAWWAVPHLLPPGWQFRPSVLQRLPLAWPVVRLRWRALCAALLSLLLLAAAVGHPAWNDDPARMSPLTPDTIALDRTLRSAASASDAGRFLLVRGPDVETVLQRCEQLRPVLDAGVAAGWLAGYELLTQFLPSASMQRARLAALPDARTLEARLSAATAGSPFRAGAFAPFLHDVAEARVAPMLSGAAYAGTGIGVRIAALRGHDNAGDWAVVPLQDVTNAPALSAALAALHVPVEFIDLRAQTGALFAQFRDRTLVAIAGSVGLIALLLVVTLRSLAAAGAVLAPALLGAGWAALAIIAFAGGLSLFHLVALMLVLGIGVNYALFLQHAFAQGDLPRAPMTTLMVVASTTGFAFAVMASSAIPVLHALGITVLVGVLATLVACILCLTPRTVAA